MSDSASDQTIPRVGSTTPIVGDTVQFTVTVTEPAGPGDSNVAVSEVLPIDYTFSGVTSTPTGVFNANTNTWTIGTLAGGATATLTVTAVVAWARPTVSVKEPVVLPLSLEFELTN